MRSGSADFLSDALSTDITREIGPLDGSQRGVRPAIWAWRSVDRWLSAATAVGFVPRKVGRQNIW